MWLEIELNHFTIKNHGFIERNQPNNTIYTSPGLEKLSSIRDLIETEQGIAIEVDKNKKHITFGRDYLGQYPLLFMQENNKLFLTDDILYIDWWAKKNGIDLTLSEEALALYFSFGYVPQDMTLFREIKSCKNITLYHYKNDKIIEENVFTPVEEMEAASINDVERCIFNEALKLKNSHDNFDVWCSGGIDSSAMAYCFGHNNSTTEILTLGYDEATIEKFGDGEIQYASEISQHCKTPLRHAQLSIDNFILLHEQLTNGHIGPVIDTCAIAKYALSQATRNTAVTGEGGDPVFGGVKNTNVLFAHSQHPQLALGWIYAYAHRRFFNRLDDIFIHGKELTDYVVEYLNKKFKFYPGDLLRKLFYLNTIEKQGGMIFPQSYCPGKRYGISIHHPLTNLSVYQSAFHLKDEKRYLYPDGKLVLSQLFRDKIPESIIKRKKSGTIIPLRNFMEKMPANCFDVTALKSSGYFNEEILGKINTYADDEPQLLTYGFITLNKWLLNRKGVDHE